MASYVARTMASLRIRRKYPNAHEMLSLACEDSGCTFRVGVCLRFLRG